MVVDKIYDAKEALTYLIANMKQITNEEMLALGEKLYNKVLPAPSLENEAFILIDEITQVLLVRAELASAVRFLSRVNMESENM